MDFQIFVMVGWPETNHSPYWTVIMTVTVTVTVTVTDFINGTLIVEDDEQ